MKHPRRYRTAPRRLFAGLGVLALSLLSCGREVTGPGAGVRFSSSMAFVTQYTGPLASVAAGAGSVIPFERVRVVFRRADGTVALDTLVDFPSTADSVVLDLRVPLSSGAPAAGEPMELALAFVNAAGDTVFRGGPIPVVAQVRAAGSPPPAPPVVPLTYTGAGATAASVVVAPETLTVLAGDAFAISGTAYDEQSNPIAGVPLVYSSLDLARATFASAASGTGATSALRGVARVRVQLPTGAGADTATVIVLPRPGTLSVASGGSQTGAPGAALPQNVTVRLLATDGQPLADASVDVTVTTGGGLVTPATSLTDANGFASFGWTLGAVVGTQTLTVSSAGVANVVVSATAAQASATQLHIFQQVGAAYQAGDSIPSLLVEARTAAGDRDTTYADSVFLGVSSAPVGATITGDTRVAAVAGVATFNNFRLGRAGAYRMLVTAAGLSSDSSAVITIAARPASTIVLASGGAQAALPGEALPAPIVVRATDGFGNPVAGVEVLFSVASGSVTASADTTDVSGEASTAWTLGPASGAQVLTATSSGLVGSPLAVNATATSGITTTQVAPLLDTLTAIGATRLFSATARDGGGAVVPGSYTWLSRNVAIATVNDSGRVTAVANGSTWVVATEAGGTRDSAQVVVDQRLATILVSPDPRDIYLGASFTFTAQAVDGLNVPLLAQPTFTWTTASSAIASVSATGFVTGVGLGSTQVRATAGAVTGTAQLNVRTPITRIAVVRDSLTFVVSDTFSLAALEQTRSYRAVAYDTLDVAMSGITFTWASSNPSVASLDSTGSATARAFANANGFTAIRASAQGVQGAAALTVAQVMTAVELTPTSALVAPTGSVVLTARRRDANGFFIPGGSFTYASAAPSVATVSAAGVVTGVTVGGTTVTATSGAITSAPTAISVTFSVPAIISFGRDTLAIGRSAVNAPIPVYLSRPDTVPVTVNLAVADTFAFFAPTSVTIPAGSTVGTANLNGRNAGTTRIFATQGGAEPTYAGDTAVLAVQAGVRFTTTGYTLLVNDEVSTQVLLTDPAPSGGVFITYQFGTAGRVTVSPDPAFIPAGQLSANVVLRAIAAGGSTVTPLAAGVIGTSATVTTQAAVLTLSRSSLRLGAGQFRDDQYVYTPSNVNTAVPVTLTSSDTSAVTTPALTTIPGGTYYSYFPITARVPGTATLTASSPGWTTPSFPIVVTTPQVGLSGGGTFNTTNPEISLTAYAEDSASGAHYRTSALALSVSSDDPSVVQVVTPTATIAAGGYFTNTIRVIPGGTPGTTWVRVTASGHRPDSVQFTMVGPRIRIALPTVRVGAGQNRNDVYVYTPNNVTAPLVVRLTSSDPAVLSMPDSVIIPTGTYYAYFTMRGQTPGAVQINIAATGYSPDSVPYTVTTPRVDISGGGTYDNFAPPAAFTVYSTDSVNTAHYRTDSLFIAYSSSDPSVLTVTPADTILPGGYFTNRGRVTFVGEGTAYILASAPGHGVDSIAFTVRRPRVQFSFATYRIGQRQFRLPTDFYVYTPNNVTAPLTVTLTQSNAPIDSLTSNTPTITTGIYYAYFGLAGLAPGVDTIIASAPGYLPDTAIVTVTGQRRLLASGLPGTATTTSPPSSLNVTIADSVGTAHYSLDTVLVSQTSSNAAVIQPDSAGFVILPSQYFRTTRVRYVGPGTGNMVYADSLGSGYSSATTNTVTVTGPSLTFGNSRPVLGMRQYGAGTGAYVQIPNPIASPLVVRLVSTDPTVATIQDSVVIAAGQTFAYVDVRAQDVVGTVQLQASAVGYASANVTQQVTAPRFLISTATSMRTTMAPQGITVQAADANGAAHYVWEPVTVTLTSSNLGAATIDSTSVVIAAGGYFNNQARVSAVSPGTSTITASDERVESYRYNSAATTVSVTVPNLAVSWGAPLSIGVGQWLEPYASTPDNQTTPLTLSLTHATGASTSAATEVIPAGIYYVYHRITGAAVGADTITYTAPGHNLVRGPISVGAGTVGALGSWPTNLTADSVAVTLYARDPVGNVRNVSVATTFDLAVSSGAFDVAQGGVAVTSVTIPANAQSVIFYVRRLAAGSGTLTITNPTYVTQVTPTVTTP